ncbi:MAG: Tex-like N-terminal domain-containing protein [Isosphaeraceae bacterium]
MDTPIPVDLGRIAQDLQIRRVQVESVVQLLDEGNTVPFITRYRKERTGNLGEVVIREIQSRVGRLRDLAVRKETILKSIEAQGKLTEELAAAIRAADNPKRLEDLYLPYKPKKKTKASEARDKGLEPLALRIWNRDETLADLQAAAAEFLNAEKGVETADQVLEGVGHILAELIGETAAVRDLARRALWRTGKVVTTKAESLAEGQGLEYRDYFAYTEPVSHIPPHRVLAINRGDKEGPLKVKMESDRVELEKAVLGPLELEGHPHAEFVHKAAIDALDRLLLPSLEREIRRDLTEMAERHAVEVFARNLRSLILQPPIQKQVVLAIDPGFRTGCKVAVLDTMGHLVEHGVIYPHQPQSRRYEAKQYIKDLVGKHQVNVVAIGNGTACRETEELVAEVITEGTYFHEHPGETHLPGYVAPPEPPPVAEPEHQAEAAAPAAEAPAPEPAEAAPVAEAPQAPAEPVPDPAPESEPAPSGVGEAASEIPPEDLPPIAGGAPASDGETASTDPVPPTLPSPEAIADAGHPHEEGGAEPIAGETPPPAEVHQPEATAEAPAEPAPEGEPQAEAVEGESHAEAAEPASGGESHAEAAEGTPEVAAEAAAPKPQGKPPRQPRPPKPPKPRTPPPPPGPHSADGQIAQLAYVIVNEAGASVYSTSTVGREEFADLDPTTRSTISIGRRLQDPLAELVKIEPQNIGVGLYQHDVNPKHLKESLEGVIESCVNFVGVDLNTASVPLLRHVSGLNQLTARRIVDYRKEKGAFSDREQLKEVEGIGPATYTQAAGFLKIPEAAHPLDRTWVHPESYEAATKALEKLGFTPDVINHKDRMPELHAAMNAVELPALAAELGIGVPTLDDIFEALARPDRDPRDDLPKPIFKRGVLKLEDLEAGMELKGTVLNVVDFGAFVDIGLKDSGLVHISQLANRYIKSPHDVISVGDVVTVWVMSVDQERKRVSLTMVKPGTERAGAGPGASGGPGPRAEGGPPAANPAAAGRRRNARLRARGRAIGPPGGTNRVPPNRPAGPGARVTGRLPRRPGCASRGPPSGPSNSAEGPAEAGPGRVGPAEAGRPGGGPRPPQGRQEPDNAGTPAPPRPKKPAPARSRCRRMP